MIPPMPGRKSTCLAWAGRVSIPPSEKSALEACACAISLVDPVGLTLVLPKYMEAYRSNHALVGYAMLILVHELGHAWVAHWRGLHVYGISLYLFHGQCRVETPYREAVDVWVAWGGIGAPILVLVAAILISYPSQAIPHDDHELLKPLFVMLIPINVMTIVINLIPMQPLDGHKAWRFIPLLVQGLTSKKRMRVSRGKTRLKIVARNETAARKVLRMRLGR